LIVVGQIITNGIEVLWDRSIGVSEPIWVCIPVDENISDSEMFDRYALGIVNTEIDGTVEVMVYSEGEVSAREEGGERERRRRGGRGRRERTEGSVGDREYGNRWDC
jgi:hypothetical protein